MSDSTSNPHGTNRSWRREHRDEFKSVKKQGRIFMLSLAAVVVVGGLIGYLMILQPTPTTHLKCYPFIAYQDPSFAATPWYLQDALRLKATIKEPPENPYLFQQKAEFLTNLAQHQHDRLIVYIAGRGAVQNNRAYVIPGNAQAADVSTWISLEELIKKLADNPSKHKLLLLDLAGSTAGIYSGPLYDEVSDKVDEYFSRNLPPFPVLTSCSAGELSQVMPVTGTSAFGYYVQKALQGDANGFDNQAKDQTINIKELVSFVNTRVNRWAIQNTGRSQQPKLYGQGQFELVYIQGVTRLPEATAPADTPPAKEEKLSTDEKKDRDAQQKAEKEKADLQALRVVFPESLEQSWKEIDPWLAEPLRENARLEWDLMEQKEEALRLATVHRYAHALLRREQFLRNYKIHETSGQRENINSEMQKLMSSANTDYNSIVTSARSSLNTIGQAIQQNQTASSIVAFWPRRWLRENLVIPPELRTAYASVFQSLPSSGGAADKPQEPSTQAFIEVIKGPKVEAKEGVKQVTLHREALYLCWHTLCTDANPTYDKLRNTEALMKAVLVSQNQSKLEIPPSEMRLLSFLVQQSKAAGSWSFTGDKDKAYCQMIYQWLQAHYAAERSAWCLLPDGIGFTRQKAEYESLNNEYANLVRELLGRKADLRESHIAAITPRLESLAKRFTALLDSADVVRTAFDTWWDALAALQATSEMMVQEVPEQWKYWQELAQYTLELAPILETRQADSTTRDRIDKVRKARRRLLDPYATMADSLTKQARNDSADRTTTRDLQLALTSGLIFASERKALHQALLTVQQKTHQSTLKSEARDTTGSRIETGNPADLSPQRGLADRRLEIASTLLRLGGYQAIPASQITNDWAQNALILQKAWNELPARLAAARDKKAWQAAARIEAVLPQAKTTDALLQWRLEDSRGYFQWLNQRKQLNQDLWK